MIFCNPFRINDRVISANNVSLEGVDYATAVQVLRDSGQNVNLVVKRRVILPPTLPITSTLANYSDTGPKFLNVNLQRSKRKEDFGLVLGCKIYIKEILPRTIGNAQFWINFMTVLYTRWRFNEFTQFQLFVYDLQRISAVHLLLLRNFSCLFIFSEWISDVCLHILYGF